MGTPEFAVYSLEELIQSSHRVVGVVTQPDKLKGRGKNLSPPPIKVFAEAHQIPNLLQPESLKNPDFLETLKSLNADLFVVVAFRILPEIVFDMAPLGTINLHPSLLPKYRGAAPINWTLIRGESKTGVTIIKISKKVDVGGMLLQREVDIDENETAGSLHDKLAKMGSQMLVEVLPGIESGNIPIIPQDDSLATPAPKIQREDCHLSFDMPAMQVNNWIRGLSPFPTAFAHLRDVRINFYKSRVINEIAKEPLPGSIYKAQGNELQICCNPGIIEILELQKEGKKRLSTSEFLRGYSVQVGEKFS
jgi:methionyl-tRNA formyltransferase